jgi:hypothetical protein
MQGNSLLEEFDGIHLVDERLLQQPDAARETEIADIKTRIAARSADVIRLHRDGKRSAAAARLAAEQEVKRLKKQLSALVEPIEAKAGSQGELTQQASWGNLQRIQQLHAELFDEASRMKKEKLRAELERMEWKFMRATLYEQGKERALTQLEKASAKHRKPFFLWRLHFGEVFQKRGGFDIVIANPPFVRMELIMDDKPAFQRRFSHLFSGRADLYVYFYGLGLDILRDDGCLTFVSSNTYLNSKFGEKLRQHFLDVATVTTLIDFAETKVFDAVVEPAIIVLRKAKNKDAPVRILKWQEQQPLDELPEVVAKQAASIPQSSFTADPWRLETPKLLRLLDHLQSVSRPLGSYVGGDVLYGVKTGLNEAFVIDERTRLRLLDDPRSLEIIKPFVRGRDVAKWTTLPLSNWLIYTYHGVQISQYPLIEEHLRPFKAALEARATRQKWYELQQPQYRYRKFFEGPKIIYQDIARYFGMAWDDTGAYLANTCYFIPTREKWLLGVLLSSTMQFHVQKTIGSDEGGFIRLFAMHVKKFPIPRADTTQIATVERLVEYLLWLHRSGVASGDLANSASGTLLAGYFEQWVNALVYELFFPEPLHRERLYFFRIAAESDLPPLSDLQGRELSELRELFEELYEPDHALRQCLSALDSIEEIRIIEGKA